MPKPILPVTDLEPAQAFYGSIGFDVVAYDSGYGWVRYGGEEVLHLRAVEDLDTDANRASAYLHVQDAAAWHAAVSASDASPTPLEDMPWDMREFSFVDPSGNLLRVGQNI